MRSELTPTQMAEHLAKREELTAARRESGASCTTLTGRGNKQFAAETAAATGVDKRRVQEAISRAEGVTQEAREQFTEKLSLCQLDSGFTKYFGNSGSVLVIDRNFAVECRKHLDSS